MTTTRDELLHAHLRRWAEELVDLTRRNGLLYFRHTKTSSLEFSQDAGEIERRLDGRGWRFHLPAAPPEDEQERLLYRPQPVGPDELEVSLRPVRYGPEIERTLKLIRGRALGEFLDTGIWVLYVGLGRLDWVDVDGKAAQSPLYLVPVEITQEGGHRTWRLARSEDGEPALNPALAVKLELDFGITLPTLDDLEEADLDGVLDAVGRLVPSAWTLHRVAVLRTFTFYKEVIYRDLQANAEAIGGHPMVRLLAEGSRSDVAAHLAFEPEPEETLDEVHPPEELACVLDADATQRQCLVAARAGRSFVMDGPPGTGKSQTITNVIAQLLKDGKTVLFVSEKAAALEVVRNNLAKVDLEPFVLDLHSRNATRKAVAAELGRALAEHPKAPSRVTHGERETLARDRARLTAYATAVNEVRRPLQTSVHDAVGRIAGLPDVPNVAVPKVTTEALDSRRFAELREAADRLGRAWGPVARPDTFLWRELEDPAGGAARESDLRRRVHACRGALNVLEESARNVTDELLLSACRGPADAAQMVMLLGLVERRCAVGEAWLTTADETAVAAAVERLRQALFERERLQTTLSLRAPQWASLDAEAAAGIDVAEGALASLEPRVGSFDDWEAARLRHVAGRVQEVGRVLGGAEAPAMMLAEAFGLRAAVSTAMARRLAELGGLAGSPTPPEPAWLNPATRAALDDARRVLIDLLRTYRSRRDALRAIFSEKVLDLDLQGLHARFRDIHTGVRKLGGAFRADKKLLASATVSGKVTKDVIAKLDEAMEWQALAERLAHAEQRHAPNLGDRYYASRADADIDEIERAVDLAERALALAAGDVPTMELARQIGRGGEPDPTLPQTVESVNDALEQIAAQGLAELLGRDLLTAIESLTVRNAATWCAEAASRMHCLAEAIDAVDRAAATTFTLEVARNVARDRATVAALDQSIESELAANAAAFGELGSTGDAAAFDTASKWVKAVREHLGGPVRPKAATMLLRTDLTAAALRDPLALFGKAADALFGEFTSAHGSDLRSACELSFEEGASLLDQMAATVGDLNEWESYVEARSTLAREGWEATVESCEALRVPASDVGDILERAILNRWVDEVLDGDERLRPKRAVDREDLLAEFRALDAKLVANAAAEVVNACTERRPRSLAGGAGVIKQQAQLKRRHMPVRRLFEMAGDAALRLKPCFMMSPLSVSQFLPPDMHFDVVIFDEASQLREADAVCSIYRGSQLIVAGDERQLPPTDFFSRQVDSDDDVDDDVHDFESILGRCKAQGLSALPLLWHYRSRHEWLITFSNYSFYDGTLHTFPGAKFEDPELGVQFFAVDGEYRRGGTRDNPIEAEAVVDRIIEHRRRHPHLTLGVITLSVAQQVAIEVALERRSAFEPILRELVMDDRLHGFFIKNLESVQGDERDIVVLSIGYGRDEVGKLTMNFGPMNSDNGWRRLNVAVTRARCRFEVVSSITASDIDSERPSIRHLARYLDYAERGPAALALELGPEGCDAESPFEESVIRSVRSLGYDAVPQVGVAGYRLDIGVRHPTQPGAYVLGIECDGAAYHSSKVARDRDRLRQEVLERLGWTVHRIWSTAWFSDRATEEARLEAAIQAALRGDRGSITGPPANGRVEVVVDEIDFSERPPWVVEYEPPAVAPMQSYGGQFTDPSSRSVISRQIIEVVRRCGPIHAEAALRAVREAWGIGSAGARVRDAFNAASRPAVARGDIESIGEFFFAPGAAVVVRGPVGDGPAPRPVAHVAPEERELAMVCLLHDAGATKVADLRTFWARVFGWRRVGPDIETAFDETLEGLVAKGRVSAPDPVRLLT